MARLVFSSLFDRHPKLQIITHHMEAMIPFFEGRIKQGWGLEMGARTPASDEHLLPGKLKKSAGEYFRMSYAHTALSGSSSGLRCGLEVFGESNVLFASDYPFDSKSGTYLVRETIRSIEETGLSKEGTAVIYCGNLERLI